MFHRLAVLGVTFFFGLPTVVYAQSGAASSPLLLHCKSALGDHLFLSHLNKSAGRTTYTNAASILVNAGDSASIQSATGLAFEQFGDQSKYTYSAAEESYLNNVTLYLLPKMVGCNRSGDCSVKIIYSAVLGLKNAQSVSFSCTELQSAAVPGSL